jgi:hypothetical protein
VTIIYGTRDNGLSTGSAPASRLIHQESPSVLDSAEANDRFGEALAAGDFNGDTFSDLAVVVPGDNAIQIFQGAEGGLQLAGNRLISGSDIVGFDLTFHIRPGLVWGDFNGDGFGDLAIEAERTFISGSPDTPIDTFDALAIVVVIYGSKGVGLQLAGLDIFAFNNAESGAQTDLVVDPTAMTLSAGDFSNDGADDLAVGLPLADIFFKTGPTVIDGGRVTILRGVVGSVQTGGIVTTGETGLTEFNANAVPRTGERFGTALAAGDFDGDGADDLAVGTPREDVGNSSGGLATDGGFVAVFSHAATLHGFYTQFPLGQDPQDFDWFGGALASGDFNGDGAKDLVIGAPGDTINGVAGAGSVSVIYGIFGVGLPRPPAVGLPAIPGTVQLIHQASAGIREFVEAGDHFGWTLTAWNFGSTTLEDTTHADLAIGVPFEDVVVSPDGSASNQRNVSDAGLVHVIYGSESGLNPVHSQRWHQDTAGVPDFVEPGDRFGAAIY